jgi:hypothetical protein
MVKRFFAELLGNSLEDQQPDCGERERTSTLKGVRDEE